MKIIIEDNVLPILISSAIEAYDFEHKAHKKGKGNSKIETYGLLWGYMVPSKDEDGEDKIIVTTCTVETSALRHNDWVEPNYESIQAKKNLIEQYWPHLELVGTFHSHPYASPEEMKMYGGPGWKASSADKDHWPDIHEQIAANQPGLAHLIVTVTELSKKGWALPEKFSDKHCDGYSFVAGYKKLWLTAYSTHAAYTEEDVRVFELTEEVTIDASSLSTIMLQNN